MLKEVLTVSALILVVLLVRAIFKNRVPKRMIYCLWLVVLLKLCFPGTLVSLPVLPAEEVTAPVQAVQSAPVSVQPTTPTQTAPQPETQEPVTKPAVQQAAAPAAKPLTTAQILQIVWAAGSGLLGLWLISTWAVFTVRLHKSRKFLGKRGRTNIYVSKCIKSPCLAGLLPAVYLTEDVLQTDDTELILRHELTHLRHLDFLWSFCRTLAVIVYWWNPFIWLAAIFSKRDAELACDEAVAEDLAPEQRIAYARAILAQAPRKTAALSLAGPPVKERILFLTKKQKTSVLCIVLALALTVTATGCSFAELTRQESGEVTLPKSAPVAAETAESADTPIKQQEEPADMPVEQEAPAQPEPEPESTSLEEHLPVDEVARAQWADFADKWRLDYLPVFSRGTAPASTSEYLMWVFARNMDALKEQGYMTKSYVETEIRTHFEVENLTHEGLTRTWNFDGETYTAVPGGVKDRPLARLDSVIRVNLGEEPQYCVQYCLLGNGNLLDDAEWSRCRDAIVSGNAPDLSELREFTLVFTMQDGEPVFLSHAEAIQKPTAILDGSIDLSAMSVDALGQLLDELNALRPEGETAQNEKWAAVSAVKTELVDRAKESGYSYREPVTFETLNEMIGYRLMNNESLMKAFPDDAAQMEACRKENAAIEAFRATLPENGSDEEAYAYWKTYWEDVLQQDAPSYFVPSLSQTDFEAHMLALSSGKTAEELTIDTFPDVLAQDAALESFLRDLPENAAFYCANYLIEKMWYGADGNEPYTPDFALTALGRLYVLSMQYLMETYNHSTGQLAAILSHELTPEDWLYQFWGEVGLAFAGQAYTMDGIYYDEHPIEKQCMTALLRSPKRLLTATLFDYASPVDSERIEDDRFTLYEFLTEGKTNDRLRIEPAGTTREDLLAACTETAYWEVEAEDDAAILRITPESGQELRLVYSPSTN